jgi:hypothetical protein
MLHYPGFYSRKLNKTICLKQLPPHDMGHQPHRSVQYLPHIVAPKLTDNQIIFGIIPLMAETTILFLKSSFVTLPVHPSNKLEAYLNDNV